MSSPDNPDSPSSPDSPDADAGTRTGPRPGEPRAAYLRRRIREEGRALQEYQVATGDLRAEIRDLKKARRARIRAHREAVRALEGQIDAKLLAVRARVGERKKWEARRRQLQAELDSLLAADERRLPADPGSRGPAAEGVAGWNGHA